MDTHGVIDTAPLAEATRAETRLRRRRHELGNGQTLRGIGALAGLNASYLSKLENGQSVNRPTVALVAAIAKGYRLDEATALDFIRNPYEREVGQ